MKCGACGAESRGGDLDVAALHRIEGASNPEDMQAVLGITCPLCGARGALVVAYGPVTSDQDAHLLAAVDLGKVADPVAAGRNEPGRT